MFSFVISRNGLLVAGERAVETCPIFVFRVTFYVHRGSGQARVYPRRWLSLSSRAKASHFKGGIDVSSAIPPSIGRSEELPSLLANSGVVSPDSAKSTEFDATRLHTIVHCIYCCKAICTSWLLLFSSNFWYKYSSRSLYCSPK